MRISLSSIKTCSQCPSYYQRTKDYISTPIPLQLSVVQRVIEKSYLMATETGFRRRWKNIISQVDKEIFSDIDHNNPEQYETARQAAEHVLQFLRKWYQEIYMKENGDGFVQITLEEQLSNDVIYEEIPIITIQKDIPVITYIDDVETIETQMYNDIKAQGMAWLVSEFLNCEIVLLRHLLVKPYGGFAVTTVKVPRIKSRRVKSSVAQVSHLIHSGMNFPAVTEKCNGCSFKRRCRL